MNRAIPDHVQQFGTRRRAGRLRIAAIVRSNRFTLTCALVLAIILPELFHPLFRDIQWIAGIYPDEPGLIGAMAALLIGHFILRRIGILPLVDDKILVLPAFLLSYGACSTILAGITYAYSRYHLITSFVICILWYHLIGMVRSRFNHPRLAVPSEVNIDDELLTSRIEWVFLLTPRLPNNVLGIVFDKDWSQSQAWNRLLARAVLRNIPVYEMGRFREMVTGRVRLQSRPEEVFGTLLPSQPWLRGKRVIDTIGAVLALVVALPIMAVAALAIRLESPGAAIFRQTRIGYQGRKFTCYKLRTMRIDQQGPAYTLALDSRITRCGRVLRKWRIDELPQIFNILKGEMSWIGPRPEALTLARAYERDIPFYSYRHAVRPGITGWAAVHQGNVGLVDAAVVKLEYDFYYLKYFSVWLDFLIVLMSIRTVITGFGHK